MFNIRDMEKIHSPFVRKEIDGHYIVTPEIAEGYEWVFEDETVKAIEKLHGTNVSILKENGIITGVWNRKNQIPFFNKNRGHTYIIEGLINSYAKGYMDLLPDGQHFGELIGPKVQGAYALDKHIWIPFKTFGQKHLLYKSWGKYPKDFETISRWFRNDLLPLFNMMQGKNKDAFVEGVVFTHPDGRYAKIRRNMFSWFYEDNPNSRGHKQ